MSGVRCSRLWKALIVTIAALLVGCSHPKPKMVASKPSWDATRFREIGVLSQTRRTPILRYQESTLRECEAQLKRLQAEGWQFLTLAQLQQHLTTGSEIPLKSLVLTFDTSVQGFYGQVYPLLQKLHLPSALFVSPLLSNKDTDTLKQIDKEGLVTIGSYWEPIDQLAPAMAKGKKVLLQTLGHPILYCAYAPNETSPDAPATLARAVGYKLALACKEGLAQESPSILSLNRYGSEHLQQALEEREDRLKTVPLAVVDVPARNTPISVEIREYKRVKLAMLIGGKASFRHDEHRQSVGEFINEIGGIAGSSGTFFTGSSMRGTPGESLVGPYVCEGKFKPDNGFYPSISINNRPMVLWGANRVSIFPVQLGVLNQEATYKTFMPDFTDGFLGGAWIVHNGIARTKEEIPQTSVSDIHDPRFRICFGLTKEGDTVIAASMSVVDTAKLAEVAAGVGIQEAVLLDSGFSTAIIYQNKVVATGHTETKLPSRPVPSAIVLHGVLAPILDPKMVAHLEKALPATGEGSLETTEEIQWASKRRKARRKMLEKDEPKKDESKAESPVKSDVVLPNDPENP